MLNPRHVSGTLALGALMALLGLPVGLGETPADGDPDAAQEAQVYRGSLSSLAESGVEGEVIIQRMGEQLSVRVNAHGLASGSHPQHIHTGETCEEFGGVAVPLDSNLNEGDAGDFPSTEGESGSLTYNQKGTHSSYADLDLGNHTVVVHASDGTPVACAALEKRGK